MLGGGGGTSAVTLSEGVRGLLFLNSLLMRLFEPSFSYFSRPIIVIIVIQMSASYAPLEQKQAASCWPIVQISAKGQSSSCLAIG